MNSQNICLKSSTLTILIVSYLLVDLAFRNVKKKNIEKLLNLLNDLSQILLNNEIIVFLDNECVVMQVIIFTNLLDY